MNVRNRAVIRRLSFKTLRASHKRNIIAILAIALTALLFTSLFTIAMSVNEGFQQSNFRQVGGSQHGGFKYLSCDAFMELREDPAIRQYGLRRFIGISEGAPFQKTHVEISYADENWADWSFCSPTEGHLPQTGTMEAATDLRVLELLNVKPELGSHFTVTFNVDGHETTQTFTLCGWWEYDPVIVAHHILIPQSRVDAILEEVEVIPGQARDGMTGSWNLDVMLGSSLHIEQDLLDILSRHGYEQGNKEGQISIGVNWGYTGAQLWEQLDAATAITGIVVLLLIVFTGYLIIYNIFRISVTGDIRFYGLLKTIGTTPRQLRRIIRNQALCLAFSGIPIGLLLGWLTGALITPVVIRQLDGVVNVTSSSPFIFLGAAVFALITVLVSCRRPGAIAARVSPVEAIRYTEAASAKGQQRRSSGKVSLFSMAWVNLWRSPSKTLLTILSLCLAVLLLNLTVIFTNGFDMDKYLRNVPADFMVADADYFQSRRGFGAWDDLTESVTSLLQSQDGVKKFGCTYGTSFWAQEFVTEDWFRTQYGHWTDAETVNQMLAGTERTESGRIADRVQLYGMDPAILDRLTVLEGDLSKVSEPGSRCIAAVLTVDDYGKPNYNSHWAKLGDTVTIRYIEEMEYYNPLTGEAYPPNIFLDTVEAWASRARVYHDETYKVTALVDTPHALSYRYYGSDEFILNSETFCQDSGTNVVMYCAFDMDSEEKAADMEIWLKEYTGNASQDYESKGTYIQAFNGMRNMFRMLGGALSFIIALVGILNFFNTSMTGIFSRRREFAVLNAIGMTGRQLKTMLVCEGLLYTLFASILSFVLSLLMGSPVGNALSKTYWFFTYHPTIWPVLAVIPTFALLGWLIPSILYRECTKHSVVERLRVAE